MGSIFETAHAGYMPGYYADHDTDDHPIRDVDKACGLKEIHVSVYHSVHYGVPYNEAQDSTHHTTENTRMSALYRNIRRTLE